MKSAGRLEGWNDLGGRGRARPAARFDEALDPIYPRWNDPIAPTRTWRQQAVVPNLMRSRWGYQWSQSLQKFMPLHNNVGRPVPPARLQSIGEPSIGRRLEPIERQRRSSHVATETLEPIPVMGGYGDIGMQTHAAMPNTAGRRRIVTVETAFPAFPSFDRLDPIAETMPRLARFGAGGDPGSNGSGAECRKQGLVRHPRVLVRFEASSFEHPEDSTCRTRQDMGHILGLGWRKGNEGPGIV